MDYEIDASSGATDVLQEALGVTPILIPYQIHLRCDIKVGHMHHS